MEHFALLPWKSGNIMINSKLGDFREITLHDFNKQTKSSISQSI